MKKLILILFILFTYGGYGQVTIRPGVTADSLKGGELDPAFTASVAAGITATQTVEWNTAYGWGNHSGLYDVTGTATATITAHNVEFNHGEFITKSGSDTISGTKTFNDINVTYVYIGSPDTDGSWRFYVYSTALIFERRVSGTWTEKGRFEN